MSGLVPPPGVADPPWEAEVAYQGVPGAVTWRLFHPDGRIRYLKMTVRPWTPSLGEEEVRMRWARPHLPVPEVLDSGSHGGVDWLLTRALPGVPATDPALRAGPDRLVRDLARALRRFHRDAPAESCPFDFQVDRALEVVRRRAAEGRIVPERDFHPEHGHLSVREAVASLERLRPRGDPAGPVPPRAVCHGDYCLPNVLFLDGRVAGFVDLGELGVADPWWDLAVGSWSCTWNLGSGHERAFVHAYGVPWDPDRVAFYRLLYDLVS